MGAGGSAVGSDGKDGMPGVSMPSHDGVESFPVISGVLNSPGGAVGFNYTVVSVNSVANASLGLFFDVIGLCIINIVIKFIIRLFLKIVRHALVHGEGTFVTKFVSKFQGGICYIYFPRVLF
jgi:hypothetical protein